MGDAQLGDNDHRFVKAHAKAQEIATTIEVLNRAIVEGSMLGVQVTMFTEDLPGIAVPRIVADIAVLHAKVKSVHHRIEATIDTDPYTNADYTGPGNETP